MAPSSLLREAYNLLPRSVSGDRAEEEAGADEAPASSSAHPSSAAAWQQQERVGRRSWVGAVGLLLVGGAALATMTASDSASASRAALQSATGLNAEAALPGLLAAPVLLTVAPPIAPALPQVAPLPTIAPLSLKLAPLPTIAPPLSDLQAPSSAGPNGLPSEMRRQMTMLSKEMREKYSAALAAEAPLQTLPTPAPLPGIPPYHPPTLQVLPPWATQPDDSDKVSGKGSDAAVAALTGTTPRKTTTTRPPTTTTVSTTLPPCGVKGDDCSLSQCCSEPNHYCFLKVVDWGTCLDECSPGVHTDDPPAFRDPWACKMLAPRGEPEFPTLFCFMAMRSSGMELDLAKSQLQKRTGIFACDDFKVFSDQVVSLSTEVQTGVLSNFAAKSSVAGALTATWVNTAGFAEAWERVIADPSSWRHDWMVKVDPDTVLFPVQLRVTLRDVRDQVKDKDTGSGVYLKNCDAPQLQLYGSLEVLSKKALGAIKQVNRGTKCDSEDNKRMGEDMWLQRCLDAVGAAGIELTGALADRYCPVGSKDFSCRPGVAAFHPYKSVPQWEECWNAARPPAAPATPPKKADILLN